MERLGIPANFIVRLKTEEGIIRKSLLRLYYIQRIDFLPSSFILMESIVVLVLALLLTLSNSLVFSSYAKIAQKIKT